MSDLDKYQLPTILEQPFTLINNSYEQCQMWKDIPQNPTAKAKYSSLSEDDKRIIQENKYSNSCLKQSDGDIKCFNSDGQLKSCSNISKLLPNNITREVDRLKEKHKNIYHANVAKAQASWSGYEKIADRLIEIQSQRQDLKTIQNDYKDTKGKSISWDKKLRQKYNKNIVDLESRIDDQENQFGFKRAEAYSYEPKIVQIRFYTKILMYIWIIAIITYMSRISL